MASILFVLLTLFISLIVIACICYELNRTDTQIKVIHIHKGKIISEEESKLYKLKYIETEGGIIIKYFVGQKIRKDETL